MHESAYNDALTISHSVFMMDISTCFYIQTIFLFAKMFFSRVPMNRVEDHFSPYQYLYGLSERLCGKCTLADDDDGAEEKKDDESIFFFSFLLLPKVIMAFASFSLISLSTQ